MNTGTGLTLGLNVTSIKSGDGTVVGPFKILVAASDVTFTVGVTNIKVGNTTAKQTNRAETLVKNDTRYYEARNIAVTGAGELLAYGW